MVARQWREGQIGEHARVNPDHLIDFRFGFDRAIDIHGIDSRVDLKSRLDAQRLCTGILDPAAQFLRDFARQRCDVAFANGAFAAGLSVTEDGESVNYGAGANYFFDGQNGVRADWTRRDFTDDNGGEVDTYGVSYVRRF